MSLWSEPGRPQPGPGAARRGAGHLEAVERLKEWTRARFELLGGDTIVVAEVERSLPGFPPRETQVGFWTADGTRHHFRVFKPLAAVLEEDLPPAWLKPALANDGFDCECC